MYSMQFCIFNFHIKIRILIIPLNVTIHCTAQSLSLISISQDFLQDGGNYWYARSPLLIVLLFDISFAMSFSRFGISLRDVKIRTGYDVLRFPPIW